MLMFLGKDRQLVRYFNTIEVKLEVTRGASPVRIIRDSKNHGCLYASSHHPAIVAPRNAIMMQKWQIRSSLCSAFKLRPPPQCAFSTSQSRLDDERPRSNRQASAKAGRLIANLNTRGAPERMRDPGFGLRGLKPYDDGPSNATANTATKSLRIRKYDIDSPQQDEANSSRDRPRQSSDRFQPRRSTPRRNEYSSRQRDPARSSDRSSFRGPPRREGQSGQYSASNTRRDDRGVGGYPRRGDDELAALEYDDDEYDEEEEEDDDEDEKEYDLQAMVEFEEGLATPVQEEWEVMHETGQLLWAVRDENGQFVEESEMRRRRMEEQEDRQLEDGWDLEGPEDGEDAINEDGHETLDLYSGEDEDAPAKWEQAAYEGMEMAEKQINPGPKPYNPKPMTAEELHTAFITTGAGELGVAAAAKQVMGRLGRRADVDYHYDAELASRLYQGKVVRFRDAEEKKRVMWMAEEFASNTANRIMEKKGEWEPKIDVGFVPVPEKAKEEIAGKAMRGIYPAVPAVKGALAQQGQSDKEKTMAHLRRSVLLNETYSPTQGKSMVDFIAKMWPAEASSKPTQSGKRKSA